jgi:hypothetical protein
MMAMVISPRQAFEDNIRPAELLLRVFRLLKNDGLEKDGDLMKALRTAVGAAGDEQLLLIYNEVFLGLVRERAQVPAAAFKRSALNNLLRQAVVAACTGLDTYLPSLLRVNLPLVIAAKGRKFLPEDADLREYFKELVFDLPETLRLLGDPEAPLFIANKILSLTSFKYLSSKKGIHAVGCLLALEKPWKQIGEKLHREQKELMAVLDETTRRRNDIVHRADRPQADPGSDAQDICYPWAKQSVDTVTHVCLALDELVVAQMAELKKGQVLAA